MYSETSPEHKNHDFRLHPCLVECAKKDLEIELFSATVNTDKFDNLDMVCIEILEKITNVKESENSTSNDTDYKVYDYSKNDFDNKKGDRKMYSPNPVDTSDVRLDKDILELSELLAKNTHDVWAKGRLEDGWRYGTVRDDSKKLHPCLIEYDELSESEKEYDRRTALETLKLIVKLGYKISK